MALLECLQETGSVCSAAARVIEDVAAICRRHQREKLRGIPPLPPVQELERVNQARMLLLCWALCLSTQRWVIDSRVPCRQEAAITELLDLSTGLPTFRVCV